MILDFRSLTATVVVGEVIVVDPEGVAVITPESVLDIAVIDFLALVYDRGGSEAVAQLLQLRDIVLAMESLLGEIEQIHTEKKSESVERTYTDDELRELFGDDDGSIVIAMLNRAQAAEAENKRMREECNQLLKFGDFWRKDQGATRAICNCCGAFSFERFEDVLHDKNCVVGKLLLTAGSSDDEDNRN